MSVDCQWIQKNLEALFCDRMTEQDIRFARAHIESCVSCRRETQALNAIDPVIKEHFRRELEIARRPLVVKRGRVFGLSSAAAAVVIVLALLLVRASEVPPGLAPVALAPTTLETSSEVTAPIKNDEPQEVLRAKPSPEINAPGDRKPQPASAVGPDAPDFRVTDPAGYSHTLDEYRGRVVVIGVWSNDQTESIANIERIYKAFGADSKFRFMGVSNTHEERPPNTTFPVVHNQGSKLFGAAPGDFVLLDPDGTVELRGRLVNDFEILNRALRGK